MLILFTALFLAQIFFHIFKGISPLQYVQRPPYAEGGDQSGGGDAHVHHRGGGSPSSGDDHLVHLGATNGLTARSGGLGSTSSNGNGGPPRRRRPHKQFIPDVLKGDGHGGSGMMAGSGPGSGVGFGQGGPASFEDASGVAQGAFAGGGDVVTEEPRPSSSPAVRQQQQGYGSTSEGGGGGGGRRKLLARDFGSLTTDDESA